jgi:cell division protein FtsN
MKKYLVLCAGLCAFMAFTSCKSSESAYKKAYEKAKAQEAAQTNEPIATAAPVVTPLENKQVSETTVMDNADNATVRSEDVTVVSGPGLKNFSVVVGSYSLKANAEGMQRTLKNAGYDAQIAYKSARNMYRVVATTFADKAAAVSSRNQLRSKYADAWLLFKK